MILIAFGSNLPFCGAAPAQILRLAGRALGEIVEFRRNSGIYRSPAWPDPKEPEFANAVCEIATDMSPAKLLAVLHGVEAAFGRRRHGPRMNAARTLDLDLLAFHDQIIDAAGLILPHPRLEGRKFVLTPLAEIAPEWRHPATGLPVCELLTMAAGEAERVEPW
jgi:2-amino-4-hydroxy-6-hydroxymethyldihydropteridine diphosphokinase